MEESSYTKEISDIIEVKATKKLSTKTRGQYISIFNYMDDKNWHKTSEIVNLLGIKETRAKELLKELISMEVLEDNGKTKGKMQSVLRKITPNNEYSWKLFQNFGEYILNRFNSVVQTPNPVISL